MVTTGYNANGSMTSADGINWVMHLLGYALGTLLKWIPALGKFVCWDSYLVSTSTDGISWTPKTAVYNAYTYVTSMTWSQKHEKLYATTVEYNPTVTFIVSIKVVESTDGLNWSDTYTFMATDFWLSSIIWSPETQTFVIVGWKVDDPYGWVLGVSSDAVEWYSMPVIGGTVDFYSGIVYSPELVAIATAGGYAYPDTPFYLIEPV